MADTRRAWAPMTCARPEGRPRQAVVPQARDRSWVHLGQRLRYGPVPQPLQRQLSLRLLLGRLDRRSGRMRAGWQRSHTSACARPLRSPIPAIPPGRFPAGPRRCPSPCWLAFSPWARACDATVMAGTGRGHPGSGAGLVAGGLRRRRGCGGCRRRSEPPVGGRPGARAALAVPAALRRRSPPWTGSGTAWPRTASTR